MTLQFLSIKMGQDPSSHIQPSASSIEPGRVGIEVFEETTASLAKLITAAW